MKLQLPCLRGEEDPYKFDVEKYVAENFANDPGKVYINIKAKIYQYHEKIL